MAEYNVQLRGWQALVAIPVLLGFWGVEMYLHVQSVDDAMRDAVRVELLNVNSQVLGLPFQLLQLRVLRLGFLQDGDAGVGIFPQRAQARLGRWNQKIQMIAKGWPPRLRDRFRSRRDTKRLNGVGLVCFDGEDRRQVGQLKKVLHPLAGIDQYQLPAMIAHGGISFN
jgi:hypothetical protein